MTGPVPESMLAAQSRIAAIRAMVMPRSSGSGAAFGAALAAASSGSATGVGLTASSVGGSATGDRAVELAKQHLGTPYVWGAGDPATGFDCSGLVQYVYGKLGVDLPRVSKDQARAGEPVASLAEARPGDLVFFDYSAERAGIDHVGIYAGDGKMVVAPKRGDVVKIQEITTTPAAIRRVVSGAPAAGAAVPVGGGSFEQLFQSAGARHGVSPALLASVARAESGMNPRAVSPAGAQGLMQLMPGTAKSLGVDAFDPRQAVDGAARLLKSHLETFGSTELALAAYNAGPGAVRRHGGIPPYAETQTYVRRVIAGIQGGTAWN